MPPMPPIEREQREQKLQYLADENSYWAEEELHLLETIRRYKKRLVELPDIIRRLNEERERVTAEMIRTGAEHDALEAENDDCPYPCDGCEAILKRGENCPSYVNAAIFRTWADEQADDYADHRLAVQPPVGW